MPTGLRKTTCETLWPEVLFYIAGMFLIIFGIGSIVVSIDPRPFDPNSWKTFLSVGICFVVIGCILLGVTAGLPTTSVLHRDADNTKRSLRGFTSTTELLDDVQSVDRLDAAIVEKQEAINFRDPDESLRRTIKGCMMMQSPLTGCEGIVFYKETIV